MFRSKLPQKGGTLPSGYRSRSISRFHAMHRNRSGSSVLLLAIEAGSREKVGRVALSALIAPRTQAGVGAQIVHIFKTLWIFRSSKQNKAR